MTPIPATAVTTHELQSWLQSIFRDPEFDGDSSWFHPEHVHHDCRLTSASRWEFSRLCRYYPETHEDIELQLQTIYDDLEFVSFRFEARGRMVGPVPGLIPSGRRLTTTGTWSFRRRGAAIIESWSHLATRETLQDAELIATSETRAACGNLTSLVGSEKHQPLAGRPERCYWARRWRIGPRLAQTAVLIMNGYDRRRIAKTLGLCESTVQSYVKELFKKAGVHGRFQLAQAASRIGRSQVAV